MSADMRFGIIAITHHETGGHSISYGAGGIAAPAECAILDKKEIGRSKPRRLSPGGVAVVAALCVGQIYSLCIGVVLVEVMVRYTVIPALHPNVRRDVKVIEMAMINA